MTDTPDFSYRKIQELQRSYYASRDARTLERRKELHEYGHEFGSGRLVISRSKRSKLPELYVWRNVGTHALVIPWAGTCSYDEELDLAKEQYVGERYNVFAAAKRFPQVLDQPVLIPLNDFL